MVLVEVATSSEEEQLREVEEPTEVGSRGVASFRAMVRDLIRLTTVDAPSWALLSPHSSINLPPVNNSSNLVDRTSPTVRGLLLAPRSQHCNSKADLSRNSSKINSSSPNRTADDQSQAPPSSHCRRQDDLLPTEGVGVSAGVREEDLVEVVDDPHKISALSRVDLVLRAVLASLSDNPVLLQEVD